MTRKKVEFKIDDRAYESIEKMERQGRFETLAKQEKAAPMALLEICQRTHHGIESYVRTEDYETVWAENDSLRQSLAALEAKFNDEKANHDSLKHILSALEIMMRDEVVLLSKEDPDFADGSIASTLTALMTYTRRITSDNSRLTLELEAARAKAKDTAKATIKQVNRDWWDMNATGFFAKYETTDFLNALDKAIDDALPLPAADEIGGDE